MRATPPDMKLRLSAELRQRIEKAAKQNNRTMNGEIVARLEASFREEDERSKLAAQRVLSMRLTDTPDPTHARLTKLEDEFAKLKKLVIGSGYEAD